MFFVKESLSTLKYIVCLCSQAICLYSKLEPVPRFRNLSFLHTKLYPTDIKWLPTFLEICPNLKSLILVMIFAQPYDLSHLYEDFVLIFNVLCNPQVWVGDYEDVCSFEMNQISFSSVPECLSSSLEFVDIKSSISGHVAEMKLIRYFLESSAILKKLTLRLNCYATQNVIFKSLLKIPRRSVTCEVVVL